MNVRLLLIKQRKCCIIFYESHIHTKVVKHLEIPRNM